MNRIDSRAENRIFSLLFPDEQGNSRVGMGAPAAGSECRLTGLQARRPMPALSTSSSTATTR